MRELRYADRKEIPNLTSIVLLHLRAFREVKTVDSALNTDDEVFDWLSENEDDEGEPYELPPMRASWK